MTGANNDNVVFLRVHCYYLKNLIFEDDIIFCKVRKIFHVFHVFADILIFLKKQYLCEKNL